MDRYKTIEKVVISLDVDVWREILAEPGMILEVEDGDIYVFGENGERFLTLDSYDWLKFCLDNKKIEKIP